jgi:sirohydrochlorin cobaltochelatase
MPPTTAAPDLTDAALLLCAHGRGESGESGEGVPEAHAAALRQRRCFARVETCVLRGAPGIAEALAGIDVPRVFLVPLLMADGHTNRVLLPEMLAQAGAAARRVTLCRPVGLSPALAPLAAAEVATLCAARGWRPAETAVVIAGHGTERHADSGASAGQLARRLAALGRFASVAAAFLEQAPSLEEVLRALRPQPAAVVGFFMDRGGHSVGDIPRLIAAIHPDAAYTGAIGAHPGFAEIVLDAAWEAAREAARTET